MNLHLIFFWLPIDFPFYVSCAIDLRPETPSVVQLETKRERERKMTDFPTIELPIKSQRYSIKKAVAVGCSMV
jgi:hypothetical protein